MKLAVFRRCRVTDPVVRSCKETYLLAEGNRRGEPRTGQPNEFRRGRKAGRLFARMKRVFLETYGCQMNVADSETMAGVLERAGMELTERPEDADAVLLNT